MQKVMSFGQKLSTRQSELFRRWTNFWTPWDLFLVHPIGHFCNVPIFDNLYLQKLAPSKQ